MLMKNPQHVRYSEPAHQVAEPTHHDQEYPSREMLLGQIALVLLFVLAVVLRSMA